MTSSIISVIYDQLNPLIVGVRFAPVDLAYYNKGNSFPMLINATVSDTLAAVLFPVMSKVQDNKEDVLNITRRYVKVSSYVLFPVMAGMFAVAETFVEVLLTEKWLPAVPYVRIFAFSYMFNMIQVGNIQAIMAIGRSDIILTTEILKKSLYFAVIAAFVFLSDNAVMLALSSIVCTMIALVINTYPTRKLIGYYYRYQLQDLLPNLLIAGIMAAVVLLIGMLSLNNLLLLIVQIAAGVVVYVALSIVTRNENFRYLLEFILQIIQRR
jgi:O-antigen/teichoic acid export membrane protein